MNERCLIRSLSISKTVSIQSFILLRLAVLFVPIIHVLGPPVRIAAFIPGLTLCRARHWLCACWPGRIFRSPGQFGPQQLILYWPAVPVVFRSEKNACTRFSVDPADRVPGVPSCDGLTYSRVIYLAYWYKNVLK